MDGNAFDEDEEEESALHSSVKQVLILVSISGSLLFFRDPAKYTYSFIQSDQQNETNKIIE